MKVLGLLLPLLVLTSCTFAFDPVTGKPVVSTDPEGVQAVADALAERLNESLRAATK